VAAAAEPILLVEDTPSLSHLYATLLRRAGYAVTPAFTAGEAASLHAAQANKVVLLDLALPDGDGIDVLRSMRRADPDVCAIVITANGSVSRAVEAMRSGAYDFLVKPFDENRLLRAVESAVATAAHPVRGVAELDAPADAEGPLGFVGDSPVMRRIYGTIRDVGRSSATVFITGESGTGKEVCAQAIHDLSPRKGRPFVPVSYTHLTLPTKA
jgi:DNA-binding NtrC family response regulator